MPKILDYHAFCENLEEVTSLKTFGKKKFHPEGLFSEQIFGPVKNYTCQCGTYHGPSKNGKKCDTCKVDIVNSDERRKRFAKIVMPIEFVNPLFYDLLCELGGKNLKNAIDDLMKQDKSILYCTNDEYVVTTTTETIPDKAPVWERTEAIRVLVEFIANEMISEGEEEWKIVRDNIDSLLINSVIVLPPELRPTSKASGESRQLMDKINRYYIQLLTKKDIMKSTIINIMKDKNLYYTYFKQIQRDVDELYKRILEKIAKKEGLIRGNILGKRIDFSGRAVIAPDPTLDLEECKLPYLMVLEMFKLPIAKRLIQIGKFKLLNKAIDFVEECYDKKSPVLYRICEDITKDEVCVLNRQPSLHRLGMLGFKIKLTLDEVIKIHPLVCPPFNADFDGDQMATYIPITGDAKREIIDKMLITKNLSSPANESLTTTPSQDIILGIYYLTNMDYWDKNKLFEYKGKQITEGQLEFNKCLPDDYPCIDFKIDKNKLMVILTDIKDRYPSDIAKEVLDNVKTVGFKYATLFGCTLSLEDCYMENSHEIKDPIFEEDDIRSQLFKLSDGAIVEEIKKQFKYSYMIESGARGSWDQVKQLILSRGFISNFEGEILPEPIKNSLMDGLKPKEFFYSTYGSRKGLLDVALNTGSSGYLSRKLIFTCANLQLDQELDDCGTEDFLEVHVDGLRKAKMLVNRFYKDGDKLSQITQDNYREFINKTIEIRSPILCESPRICKTCYGDLYKRINSRFIGIIAAQTLGERGTQLVLRTFHTSGSAVIKGQRKDTTMRQKDIIGDLASVSKLLHRFDKKTHTQLVSELFEVYDKDIHHVHFECVVAQLMWKDYKKWRLLPNRNEVDPNFYSIQSVPNQESWILAMAFSNPKRSILQGILYEGRYSGIMDKILKGERIQ